MPDLADRLSDQRRLVPQPQRDRAAGPRRQRHAAGADALVDDVSDDRRRHVFKALAPAIPDRVIAGHHADLLIAAVPRHQSARPTSSSSAISARSAAAGAPSAPRTASRRPSASMTATRTTARTSRSRRRFPVRGRALCAGAGFRRRRPSSRRARRRARGARARAASRSTARSSAPIAGPGASTAAATASGNAVALRLDGAWKTDFPNAKVLVAQLKAGDAFRMRSGGGGGYGAPLERPAAEGADDVRQGYVSVAEGGGALRRGHRPADLRGERESDRATAGGWHFGMIFLRPAWQAASSCRQSKGGHRAHDNEPTSWTRGTGPCSGRIYSASRHHARACRGHCRPSYLRQF